MPQPARRPRALAAHRRRRPCGHDRCVHASPTWSPGRSPAPARPSSESTAGFTTTALTVIEDPESLERGILFWRASHSGSAGFAALATVIAVLPFLGVGGPADARTVCPLGPPHLRSGHVRQAAGPLLRALRGADRRRSRAVPGRGHGPVRRCHLRLHDHLHRGVRQPRGSFSFFDSALLEWMGVAGMFLGGLSLAIVWSVLRGRSAQRARLARAAGRTAASSRGHHGGLAVVESPGDEPAGRASAISAFTATSAVSSTGHWVDELGRLGAGSADDARGADRPGRDVRVHGRWLPDRAGHGTVQLPVARARHASCTRARAGRAGG